MTVSTPLFDLIFERKQFKEQRLAKLQVNYKRAESKIENLLENPWSEKREERIAFIKGINFARSYRLEAVKESIDWLDGLLPKDKFSLSADITKDEVTGEASFVSVKYEITDSPYDDTFVGGQPLAFSIRGKSPFRRATSTYSFKETAVADGVTTGQFGSSGMAGQYNNYDEFSVLMWDKPPVKDSGAKVVCEEVFV